MDFEIALNHNFNLGSENYELETEYTGDKVPQLILHDISNMIESNRSRRAKGKNSRFLKVYYQNRHNNNVIERRRELY